MVANMTQCEHSNIKCYTSTFSNNTDIDINASFKREILLIFGY